MAKRGGASQNLGLSFGDFFRSIIGMFGFNTFTICQPDDESLYCKITQYFQLMIIGIVVFGLLYFAVKFLSPSLNIFGGKKYRFTNTGLNFRK